MTDKITIGITCYNAAETIEAAIRSAIAQEWDNKEIIIIDDCSSDQSADIIQKLIAKMDNVTFIRHTENKGYPSALNSILENASGDFITFFDDDDQSAKDRLRQQNARIKEYQTQHPHAQMVFCYTNRAVILPGADQPDHIAHAIGREAIEPHGKMVADYVLLDIGEPGYSWGMFGSCTLMASKESFAAIAPFDPDFRRCAELDMAIRAGQKGAHFIACNDALVSQHKTYTSDKSKNIVRHYVTQLRVKHKTYLKNKKAYLASLMIAKAATYPRFIYMIFLCLACLLSPGTLMKAKLRKLIKAFL